MMPWKMKMAWSGAAASRSCLTKAWSQMSPLSDLTLSELPPLGTLGSTMSVRMRLYPSSRRRSASMGPIMPPAPVMMTFFLADMVPRRPGPVFCLVGGGGMIC